MEQVTEFKKWIKVSVYAVIGIFAFFTIISMFNNAKMGYTYVYQNAVTGESKVYHGPDFIFKPPFIANITEYKNDTTLTFSNSEETDDDILTAKNNPIKVAFADTYKADLILSGRAKLPLEDEQMLKLHNAFRSYDNLVASLYSKTMVDVAVNTATQFTAEEVFQGGLNGLKSAIEDQSSLGVYVTERRKVRGESGMTEQVGVGESKTDSELVEKAVYVWKAIPMLDRNGKVRRTKNPLIQYGVEISQVNLAEPIPEPLLEKLLNTKKTLVAEKIASIQMQENAKTNIETAKLEGEAARVKAEQIQLVNADAEIIQIKKEVQLAEQQALKEIVEQQKLADLAKIDKAKELQIAKDNEGIQKANEVAAKYEAQAKLHNGLADAEIKKAMYLAVRKDILELEVQKSVTEALATNLKDFKVQMPTYMSGNSNGEQSNSLGVLMDALSIQNLKEINTKLETK